MTLAVLLNLLTFCQKMKIGRNYFLLDFDHYLISACYHVCLVLIRWVTYKQWPT